MDDKRGRAYTHFFLITLSGNKINLHINIEKNLVFTNSNKRKICKKEYISSCHINNDFNSSIKNICKFEITKISKYNSYF